MEYMDLDETEDLPIEDCNYKSQKKHYFAGPYCDMQSHNLVLQKMNPEEDYEEFEDKRGDYHSELEDLTCDEHRAKMSSLEESAERIKELLKTKGGAFMHTSEYYTLLSNKQERMKAYQSLELSSAEVCDEDIDIIENPFKFLYLPQDATFGQVRAAWISQSKFWFPDLMHPEDQEKYKAIFGNAEPSLENEDYAAFVKKVNSIIPLKILSTEELERLSPLEQETYKQTRELYQDKKAKYEKVESDMRTFATKKMQVINKAYGEAKKRFSNLEIKSFDGFCWKSKKKNFKKMNSLVSNFEGFQFENLDLEGEGCIRKDFGKYAFDNAAYLAFDFGEIEMGEEDYRQKLPLKSFFAWSEIIQGKELCPTLLEDIADYYQLNSNKKEQLRLMIINKESPDFVIKTLGIPLKAHTNRMGYFLKGVYEGPTFYKSEPYSEGEYFPLGIEFTPEGSLIINYESQFGVFTPLDVQMMEAIAYGPLLN